MERPNWLDEKFEKEMSKATAEQCLLTLAKDQKVIQAVRDALTSHDNGPKIGPSRTQAVRKALVEVLQAQS